MKIDRFKAVVKVIECEINIFDWKWFWCWFLAHFNKKKMVNTLFMLQRCSQKKVMMK